MAFAVDIAKQVETLGIEEHCTTRSRPQKPLEDVRYTQTGSSNGSQRVGTHLFQA
jgi:hypothetical protein